MQRKCLRRILLAPINSKKSIHSDTKNEKVIVVEVKVVVSFFTLKDKCPSKFNEMEN